MKNSLITGTYNNLSIENYHNDNAVGSSTLKSVAMRTPLHAVTGSSISTSAADFGTAFHAAILEPEKFETDVVRGYDDRRGNKWKDMIEANAGKVVLVSSEYDECCAARDSIYKSTTVRSLLQNKLAVEQSVFWRDGETGLMCKARPDFISNDHVIVDLKTTLSASLRSFERDAFKYGYHIQEAHYLEGMNNVSFDDHSFVFLAVEKTAPYAWTIAEFDAESKKVARSMWREALNVWASCKKKNEYIGYPERQIMRLPMFVMPSMFEEKIPAVSGLAK